MSVWKRDSRPESEHPGTSGSWTLPPALPGAKLARLASSRHRPEIPQTEPLMSRRSSALLTMVCAGLLSSGCDGFLSPQTNEAVEDGLLTIVHVAPDAPPLEGAEVSFWMVRGQRSEVEIRYVAAVGYNGKCLRLVIPAEAPLRHPDGTPIAPGDSVFVTVRVLDTERFLFEVAPAGLTLNPAFPAQLEIRYRWMADDVNGDGKVDEEDERVANSFGIWEQNRSNLRWSGLPTTRQSDVEEVRASVTLFTRYALASD